MKIAIIKFVLILSSSLSGAYAFAGSGVAGTASQAIGAATTAMTVNMLISEENAPLCSPVSVTNCVISVLAGASTLFLAADTVPNSAKVGDMASCTQIMDPVFCSEYGGASPGAGSSADNFGSNTGSLNLNKDQYQKLLGATAKIKASSEALLADLAGKGYSYDTASQTINTPNGSVAASALGDSQAMQNAGFSLEDMANIQAALQEAGKADADQALAKFGIEFMSGLGGKAFRKSKSSNSNSQDSLNKLLNQLQAGQNTEKRKPSSSVLSKNISGGERIGTTSANIFDMVTRRYLIKTSEKGFVQEQK